MAKTWKRKKVSASSEHDPEIHINLKELFKGGVRNNKAMRQTLGRQIIDKIKSKTQSNKDINGERFQEYSKSYKKVRKKAGLSTRKVDLTFENKMLRGMKIKEQNKDKLVIGFKEKEAPKAHGHISGAGIAPQRDFFGFKDTELKTISNKIKKDFKK